MAAQLNVLEADIPAGQAYSNVVGLTDNFVVGLITPDGWDEPALASVLVSINGDNYYDLYDNHGNEFGFNIVPNVIVNVDPNLLMMAKYIRLRSGRHDHELVQTRTRRFFVITRQTLALAADVP